jgi:hypothetical protein
VPTLLALAPAPGVLSMNIVVLVQGEPVWECSETWPRLSTGIEKFLTIALSGLLCLIDSVNGHK